ncbi:MAG: hypothetical protein GXY83_14595 [Rhodopirellula sp.]|nr:hypothetical protein [Rhodopirellula sp.]
MAFTVSDFNDLKQLLTAHPEWQVELRNLLLKDDFLALPGLVRDLVEAQRRTDERFDALAAAIAKLTETQQRFEIRLGGFETRMDGFDKRMERFEDRLGRLQGDSLEIRYRLNAASYFGRWLRRTRVVGGNDLTARVEKQLSPDELHELLLTDLIVRGLGAYLPGQPEVWLAVEISCVVDRKDVARAVRRAALIRRAGLPGLPVVAGETATDGAETEARERGVAMLQNSAARYWDEMLAAWPI